MSEQSVCANELIALKDHLHRLWFDLQRPPQNIKRDFSTLLDRAATDDIIKQVEAAFVRAKECNTADHLRAIGEQYLANAKKKRMLWEKERYNGLNYYSAYGETGTEFLITDLNYAINTIHNLGAALLKATGNYAGCYFYEDVNSVNRGSLAFCEGIPMHYGSRIGFLMNSGQKVEEQLGCHKAVVNFEEHEKGYELDVDFSVPSGYISGPRRLDGVKETLEGFGLGCEKGLASIRCKGVVSDMDILREMAYFFDSITDVDMLLPDCADRALEHARSQAKAAVSQLHDSAYTKFPTPHDRGAWVEDVCPDIYKDVKDKEKQAELEMRQADVNNFMERADAKLDKAKVHACDIEKYELVRMGEGLATNAKWNCERLVKLTGEDESKCQRLVDDWKVKAESISRGIVQSCPPDPIIDKAEKDLTADADFSNSHEYLAIRMVCQLSDDDECETALYKANEVHNLRMSLSAMEEEIKVAYNNLKSTHEYKYMGPCDIDRLDFIRAAKTYFDNAMTYCLSAASQKANIEGGKVNFRQCNDLGDKFQQDLAEEAKKFIAKCPVGPLIEKTEKETVAWYEFDKTDNYAMLETLCKAAGDDACLEALEAAVIKHQARENA